MEGQIKVKPKYWAWMNHRDWYHNPKNLQKIFLENVEMRCLHIYIIMYF